MTGRHIAGAGVVGVLLGDNAFVGFGLEAEEVEAAPVVVTTTTIAAPTTTTVTTSSGASTPSERNVSAR